MDMDTRRAVRRFRWRAALLPGLLAGALMAPPAPAGAQGFELSTRVWLDRGDDPVLSRGERVRLYYRTNADAYVAIFQIDTNGTVRLLYPRSPEEDHWVRGGRDYRLLFPRSTWWTVDDDPGVGYFFAVASPEPFHFGDFRYSHFQGGWDLSFVGRTVYADPYAAMDEYIGRLIPDWEYVPYALDFTSYHVERRYDYPRFLCYDCHGFRPYATWNPYFYTCTTYRVVVYNDPYYYPASRYRGDRVVWVRPAAPFLPRFDFKERVRGEPGTPLVASRPAVADRPGVGGSAAPRRSTGGIGSGGVAPLPRNALPDRSGTPGTGVLRNLPRNQPTPRRPSDALPGRATPTPDRAQPGTVRPPTGSGVPGRVLPAPGADRTRPVLERRPPAGSGGSGGSSARPAPRTRPGGGGAVPTTRPSTRPPASPPSGGSRPPVVRRPTGGGSGSASPARPTVRKPGGGGSSPPARPAARKPAGGGNSTPARPAARKPGGGGSPPPARPPVRKPGGGGSGGGA